MIRALLVLCKACLLWMAVSANAHTVQPGIATLALDAARTQLSLRVNAEVIMAGVDVTQINDTDALEGDAAARYGDLRGLTDAALAERLNNDPAWLTGVRLQSPAGPLTLSLVDVAVEPQPDPELPRFTTVTLTASPASSVRLAWAPSYGELVVRERDGGYNAFLAPGEWSAMVSSGQAALSTWDVMSTYIVSGVAHIIPMGLDHILFVAGLYFFGAGRGALIAQISVFTVAHTLTLALASLAIVRISPAIVEPLIAASIVYIGVENLLRRGRTGLSRRLMLVFAFGLLHGLGFASVLSEFGLQAGAFGLSLISFNVGVEIGQLLVIAPLALLLGTWAARQDWYRAAVQVPASLAIAAVGAYWVLERTLLA
ncbi:HupE/UreJ family protein [Litorivicinus lipolyticus]|nr:HupE/UreJ family protein [Litorivicinus lipolyticus]